MLSFLRKVCGASNFISYSIIIFPGTHFSAIYQKNDISMLECQQSKYSRKYILNENNRTKPNELSRFTVDGEGGYHLNHTCLLRWETSCKAECHTEPLYVECFSFNLFLHLGQLAHFIIKLNLSIANFSMMGTKYLIETSAYQPFFFDRDHPSFW